MSDGLTKPVFPRRPRRVVRAVASTISSRRFGFNPVDDTLNLQSALNLGSVVDVAVMGGVPHHCGPLLMGKNDSGLTLRSGVEVRAKSGLFSGIYSSLVSGVEKDGVSVYGQGGVLRMLGPNEGGASASEFRHCFTARACTNVSLSGVAFANSGGDGIYIGFSEAAAGDSTDQASCSDVEVRGCSTSSAYRCGMSVTACRSCLVDSCSFVGTSGVAPQAGIDVEPSLRTHSMVDVTVSRCKSSGNAGVGFVCNLYDIDNGTAADNHPSVLFDQCSSSADGYGLRARRRRGNSGDSSVNPTEDSDVGPDGTMEFRNCSTVGALYNSLLVEWQAWGKIVLRLTNCTFRHTSASYAPILLNFVGLGSAQPANGGVVFDNCTVYDTINRSPVDKVFDDAFVNANNCRATGTIRVVNPALPLGAYNVGIPGLTVTVVSA